MFLRKAVDKFMEGYFSTNYRSRKTIKAYAFDLKQFAKASSPERNLSSIEPEQIERWVNALKSSRYAPASIRRKTAALKVFFNYWVRKKEVENSPFWHLKIDYGRPRELTKYLLSSEMKSLLHQAKKETEARRRKKPASTGPAFLALRNLAIIELLFNTGIRVGELASIGLADLLLEERTIKIKGKGRRERLAFIIGDYPFKVITDYLACRKTVEGSQQALFINVFRTPLSTQGVANIIKKLSQDAGIEKHVTPHMIRHTAATLLLRNGADLRIVQEFLGHASISSTQRYTHIAKDHLLESLQKLHPRNLLHT